MLDDFGGGNTLNLPIAYNDEAWQCYAKPRQFPAFQPNSSATFKAIFITNGYLTHSESTFDPSAHTNCNLDGPEVLFVGQDITSTTFSGPNKCPHNRAVVGESSYVRAAGEGVVGCGSTARAGSLVCNWPGRLTRHSSPLGTNNQATTNDH